MPLSTLFAADLEKSASWDWPEVGVFEQQLLSYLDQNDADSDLRDRVEEHWSTTADHLRGPDFLDRLLSAAAIVDSRIAELIAEHADVMLPPTAPGSLEWLTSDVPGWLQDTIRLASGRAFAQRLMYDEALEALDGLELRQVCDPSSLIFYRAVCEHHLLKQEACLKNLQLLLQRDDEIPTRFAQVATLMKADIEPLEQDSLDEVARLMRDVERRLDLGRAGTRVREEEEQIVSKLDKMIEAMEQQLQQQQQQASGQNGNGSQQQQPASPMDDSRIAGGSGPGDVDNKDIGDRAGWGNLPPAERQESLQRLTEDLPSHYRDVIEGYFRELAKGAK